MFTFNLTEAEANLILQALSAQPYGTVAALIAKMQDQARQQMSPAPEPTPQPNPGGVVESPIGG